MALLSHVLLKQCIAYLGGERVIWLNSSFSSVFSGFGYCFFLCICWAVVEIVPAAQLSLVLDLVFLAWYRFPAIKDI